MRLPRKIKQSKAWLKAPARWRHSKGFGIHSPFAYDLIVNTLREHNYRYYAYSYIDNSYPSQRKVLKLLLRLMCRLTPKSIASVGELSAPVARLAPYASGAQPVDLPEKADMLIISSGAAEPLELLEKSVAGVLMKNGTVVVTDIKQFPTLQSLINRLSMTFYNRRLLIGVGRRDLPRQHFDLFF